jgi:DNA end-binding protein Ku
MRQRQHLATLRVMEGRGLALHTMHFADEVTNWDQLESELPKAVDLKKQELDVAKQLITALGKEFDASEYHDEYRERLEQLIESKTAGEEIAIAPSDGEDEIPPTYNLMEALKKSLKETKPAAAGRKKVVRKRRAS